MLELAPEEAVGLSEKELRHPSANSLGKSDASICSRRYTFTPPAYPHVVSDKHYHDLT